MNEKLNILRKTSKFLKVQPEQLPNTLRRFKKDGWILTYLKYIFAEIYMIIFGDIKRDIFNYRFGHYRDGDF